MMTLRESCQMIPGASLEGAGDLRFRSVSTDSRSITEGALFVALEGENFDGHDYVAQVAARGAVAAIVSRRVPASIPLLVVEDTRRALGYLARGWRRRFSLPVILVTGSNGKTTTKEMIASILSSAFGEEYRLATQGNLNNDIGLPLTLLKLRTAHRAAVIELGMNHPGETEWLADIATPDVVVITNAQREHQEFMQSVAAVAAEHALAIGALPNDGILVFPADDAHAEVWRNAAGTRRISRFGLAIGEEDGFANIVAKAFPELEHTVVHMNSPLGAITTTIHSPGLHNVRNAAAATAATLAIGVSTIKVREGLERFRPVKGRNQVRSAFNGTPVIDDTYNANPDSVRAAIEVLAARPAPRLLVLGDMGEVGASGQSFHIEVGEAASALGIERFMATGVMMRDSVDAFGANASHFERIGDLGAAVHQWIEKNGPEASVLVKGSRFMAMERVVNAVLAADSGATLTNERH